MIVILIVILIIIAVMMIPIVNFCHDSNQIGKSNSNDDTDNYDNNKDVTDYNLSLPSSLSHTHREGSLEVLKDLLTRNLRQNLNIVVQIASKYSDPLGPENLMKVRMIKNIFP